MACTCHSGPRLGSTKTPTDTLLLTENGAVNALAVTRALMTRAKDSAAEADPPTVDAAPTSSTDRTTCYVAAAIGAAIGLVLASGGKL